MGEYNDDELDEGLSGRYRTEIPDGDDDMLEDTPLPFRVRTSTIINIVVLLIIILIVRRFLNKRDRNGCTFLIIAFAIVLYLIDRYVYW